MKFSLVLCSDMHMDIEKANILLGCSENVEWVSDYTLADVIIIMTCAFGNKKRYSMFVIADVIKNAKPGSRIIATGCLTKINATELKAIPKLEVKSFEEVVKMISNTSSSTPKQMTYKIPRNEVIISNGCLKKCSYCIYPLLEKEYTSKPIEEVLSEVEELYQTKPVIYITGAHETSDYGIDLYGYKAFAKLMDSICTKFPNCKYVIGWFHPSGLTDEVIEVIKKYKNIIQIMVHVQHNDNEILKAMHRPSFESTDAKIQKLHLARPDLSISTELIVGFPGETWDKFNFLVDYLEKNKDVFQDIGVASYEPVLNTKSAQLDNLPNYEVRNERMKIIQKKFHAAGYPGPVKDFQPLLSNYFEACYLLSQIPDMCIETTARQKYPYIAGIDTDFKISLIENFSELTFEMFQDIVESKEKYTPNFRSWLMQLAESQGKIGK